MSSIIAALLEGFATSAGLIIAIGAQNAFVLKQGIQKNHIGIIVLICALIDSSLIFLGVNELGYFLASNTTLLLIAKWGGAAFLTYYGLNSFWSAFKTQTLEIDGTPKRLSLKKTILTVLALSLLNPHVYLDTCILIGTIGAQFSATQRPFFIIGACAASFVWFYSIGYGARYLIPFFKKPLSWKILDCITGSIMLSIALLLIFM